jgi:hypothetical protein
MKAVGCLSCLIAFAAGINAVWAGPPFRTDDPVPVDYQHWEIYTFSTATQIHADLSGVLPGIEVNYGALDNLQLHIAAPLAFDRPEGRDAKFGYGDTEIGAKYRVLDPGEDDWWPQAGFFPAVDFPSGNARRGLGAGHTRAFLPLWLQKNFGSWTIDSGAGYWINPGAGNRNYWLFGWLVQRQVTDKLALGGEIFHQTADTAAGTDSTGFNLGGVYDFTEHYHLLFSAGRGLQNAATTNEFSYYLAVQVTY